MTQEIGTTVAIVIAFFAKEAWEKYKNKRIFFKKASNMAKEIQTDVLINDELATLRDRYDFNRAALVDYSNGITSLGGICFKNSSMRYERTDIITKPIMKEFQNVPASSMATMMMELNSNDAGYVVVTDEADDTTAIMNRMFGTKQMYIFRIGNNLVNGCVTLTYTQTERELNHEDIMDIKSVCMRIQLLRGQLKT
jgi:hypothetical protein